MKASAHQPLVLPAARPGNPGAAVCGLPVRLFHGSLLGIASGVILSVAVCQLASNPGGAAGKPAPSATTPVPPPAEDVSHAKAFLSGGMDADGDRVEDDWELAFGHDPANAADGEADFDFDGLTAKQEKQLYNQTDGAYGNPLGQYRTAEIRLPAGYLAGARCYLVESARNGLSIVRITGTPDGSATLVDHAFACDPVKGTWQRILPPDEFPNAVLRPTDINSRGQVVGYFSSGGLKGFVWTPSANHPKGGQSRLFNLNPDGKSPQPAVPVRISDSGHLLYSFTLGGPRLAADSRQCPIQPLTGSWTTPQYFDVNDYGEYIGRVLDPFTGQLRTFLAMPGGPSFLSALGSSDLRDALPWAPDVDASAIAWEPVPPVAGPATQDPSSATTYESAGGDPSQWYQYGWAEDRSSGLPAQFRRINPALRDVPHSYDGDPAPEGYETLWWNLDPNRSIAVWRTVGVTAENLAAVNDWGEFAGQYAFHAIDQTEGSFGSGLSQTSGGVFLYDGQYQVMPTGDWRKTHIHAMSNDPQLLIGDIYQPHYMVSDGVAAPLAAVLPQGTTLMRSVKPRLCDNGLILYQQDAFTLKLLFPDDDVDGDGMPDDWERHYGLNPYSPDDASIVGSSDGITHLGKFHLRADPNVPLARGEDGQILRPGIDDDQDGIPSVWEVHHGLDYLDPADAAMDFDRDGFSNLQEFQLETDPRGAPTLAVHEVGPLTGATAASVASGTLGVDASGADGLFFQATPAPGNGGSRTAGWWPRVADGQPAFHFHPPHGTATTYAVATATNGAALAWLNTIPRKFLYWASPTAAPLELHGAATPPAAGVTAHDVRDLTSARFSPSGNYLVARRTRTSNTSISEWIRWDMKNPPVVLSPPSSASGITLNAAANLHVNDHGLVAGTATLSGRNIALLWTASSPAIPLALPFLPGGNRSTCAGLSNSNPPVVAGTAAFSDAGVLRDRATFWQTDLSAPLPRATANELGTLPGGNASTAFAISPSGWIAGTGSTLVDGVLRTQVFLARPGSATSLAQNPPPYRLIPQGLPQASVSLTQLNDAGELLGTSRASAPNSPSIPTLWRNGLAHPLDQILPPATGHVLRLLSAINTQGTLVATTWKDNAQLTVLLTPDADTDSDGLPDAWENQHQFNPYQKNPPATDSDNDGLTDAEEMRQGTSPRHTDSDSDGMPDGWEIRWGLLPLDRADAGLDPDDDRVSNQREYQLGTRPVGVYQMQARHIDSTWCDPEVVSASDRGDFILGYMPITGEHAQDAEYSHWSESRVYEAFLRNESGQATAPVQLPEMQVSNFYQTNGPGWSSQSVVPEFRVGAPSGAIHGSITRSVYESTGSQEAYCEEHFLLPSVQAGTQLPASEWDGEGADAAAAEAAWLPWPTVEESLRGGWHDFGTTDGDGNSTEDYRYLEGPLGAEEHLTPWPDAVSPDGTRRIHRCIETNEPWILNERGEFLGKLPAGYAWQSVNNRGVALSLQQSWQAPSDGKSAYYLPRIHQAGPYGVATPVPIEAPTDASSHFRIVAFADDGCILLSYPARSAQFTTFTRYLLVDTGIGTTTQVRLPGDGMESLRMLSSQGKRLAGSGPRPFQITTDGTCLRLEALLIASKESIHPIPLAALPGFPNPFHPRHIRPDGSLLVSTALPNGQYALCELTPANDRDEDGIPDDWERYWADFCLTRLDDGTFTDEERAMLESGNLDAHAVIGSMEGTVLEIFQQSTVAAARVPDVPSKDSSNDLYTVELKFTYEARSIPRNIGLAPFDHPESEDVRYLGIRKKEVVEVQDSARYANGVTEQQVESLTWMPEGRLAKLPVQDLTPVNGTLRVDAPRYRNVLIGAETVEDILETTATTRTIGTMDTTPWTAVDQFGKIVAKGVEVIRSVTVETLDTPATVPQLHEWMMRDISPEEVKSTAVFGPPRFDSQSWNQAKTSSSARSREHATIRRVFENGVSFDAFTERAAAATTIDITSHEKLTKLHYRWIKHLPEIPYLNPVSNPPPGYQVNLSYLANQSSQRITKVNQAADSAETESTIVRIGHLEFIAGNEPPSGAGGWREYDMGEFTSPDFAVTKPKDLALADFVGLPMVTTTIHLGSEGADVGVDLDGDETIRFNHKDQSTAKAPYKFWTNNDADRRDTLAIDDLDQNDIAPVQGDADVPGIPCERDLEDFSRLAIRLTGPLTTALLKDPKVTLHLGLKRDSGGPAMNLLTSTALDGGNGYVTQMPIAKQLLREWHTKDQYHLDADESFDLPQPDNFSDRGDSFIHFLFEGRAPGGAQLALELKRDGKSLGKSAPLHIDLQPVTELYQTWSCGDVLQSGIQEGCWPLAKAELISGKKIPDPVTDVERDYILFVHGWNMARWEKEVWASTAYKRLWHQGYRGRYGAFRWPTYFGPFENLEVHNYNASELRAWHSAEPLRKVIEKLAVTHRVGSQSRVRLLAHSMGNIVCGETLRQFGKTAPVEAYVAAQAAVPARCWDADVPKNNSPVLMPDVYGRHWKTGTDPFRTKTWTRRANPAYFAKEVMPSNVRYINQFNSLDFALNLWEGNNRHKPTASYECKLDEGIFRQQHIAKPDRNLSFPENTYEIFAYAAQSHSNTLGGMDGIGGCFENHNINLGERPINFGNLPRSHSGQFKASIQNRHAYWDQILNQTIIK